MKKAIMQPANRVYRGTMNPFWWVLYHGFKPHILFYLGLKCCYFRSQKLIICLNVHRILCASFNNSMIPPILFSHSQGRLGDRGVPFLDVWSGELNESRHALLHWPVRLNVAVNASKRSFHFFSEHSCSMLHNWMYPPCVQAHAVLCLHFLYPLCSTCKSSCLCISLC